MKVNLTEVFLTDTSTVDNPSEKRTGEWKDASDKAARPVQRSVMSTLCKHGLLPGCLPNARSTKHVLSVLVWRHGATRPEASPETFGSHTEARSLTHAYKQIITYIRI